MDSIRMECPKCKSHDIYAILKSNTWECLCRKCGAKLYPGRSKGSPLDAITKELSKKFKRIKKQREEKDVP